MKPTLKNEIEQLCVRKSTFASAVDLSTRTVDRYLANGILPQIKLPSTPGKDGKMHGSVLIPLNDAIAALNLFRVGPVIANKRHIGRIAHTQPSKEILA